MPLYMTQKMSYELLTAVTYYRKQTVPHVSHIESEAFTDAAATHYGAANNILAANVDQGTYKSGQGVPTGGSTQEI